MDRERKELRKRRTSGQLRSPELKRQKQRNPYVAARSTSPDCNFWDNRQKELYDQICREKKVFKHRFVEWSDIADAETCPFDLATKYEDLGLKGLTSNNSSWVWNEDIVRQFYGTLHIDPDRREMHFMIGSQYYFATKEDLEKALLIEPRVDSLVLHTWDDVDVYSLFRVPNPDIGLVRDLKTEVDLIQRINRHTIYPKSGNRGGCTTMLLKLAYAIYHGKQFDIAHFLLSEMCEAIDTHNHALPYAPYIFCLLRHLKCDPTNIDTKCCLKKYTLHLASLNCEQRAASAEHEVIEVQHQQPMSYSHQPPQPVNPDSTVASNAQLSKLIEGLHEKVVKGFEAIEKRLYTMEVLFSVLSSEVSEMKACMLDPCHGLNGDKQKRAQTEAHQGGDGSSAAADP